MLPLAAVTRNDFPSEMRATEVFATAGKVNFAPEFAGVAPGMPAKTLVPTVSCDPVNA